MIETWTEWQKCERNGLLARETTEWREKRLLAENPNTTADVLEALARAVEAGHGGWQVALLGAAVAAHANTRPTRMMSLLGTFVWWGGLNSSLSTNAYAAFCQNPIIAFLPLEMPTFWQDCPYHMGLRLLREPDLPPFAASIFRSHSNEAVAHEALSHIAVAGKIPVGRGGEKILSQFWRTACEANTNSEYLACPATWRVQLAKMGMVPYWAAEIAAPRRSPKPPQPPQKPPRFRRNRPYYGAPPLCSEGIVEAVQAGQTVPALARFAAITCGSYTNPYLYEQGLLPDGLARLHAALRLPLTRKPFSCDPWNRSPLDLMDYLAHDGNRFVRWAAQTRLADPDFVFIWQDDEG